MICVFLWRWCASLCPHGQGLLTNDVPAKIDLSVRTVIPGRAGLHVGCLLDARQPKPRQTSETQKGWAPKMEPHHLQGKGKELGRG